MDKNFAFDPETHTYFLNGKPLISVTQLLKKHGLAPDYSGVDEETLNRAAERGTLIHNEIEDYIKSGEVGFTPELVSFIERFKTVGYDFVASEVAVHNDVIAGTIDLILDSVAPDNEEYIIDFKTTSSINFEAVSWQLSLYAYLRAVTAERYFSVKTKLQEWHFQPDGSLRVIDIPLQPWEEIERLLECERNGETYTRNLEGIVTDAQVAEIEYAENLIAEADRQKKEAEARLDGIKASLQAEMEKRGIKSFETDRLKLTYVLPGERTTIDSARLKKELPDIAAQFSKTTSTAASLRITFKGDK